MNGTYPWIAVVVLGDVELRERLSGGGHWAVGVLSWWLVLTEVALVVGCRWMLVW